MFNEVKNKVKKLIENSKDKEVTNSSNINNDKIGIYMIYIDNFDDEKIIPIYIGQTERPFVKRYKEHLQEIMALNRLSFGYYREALLSGFYEKHYKSCKIFQYMVNHNCTLKDFHMIILEELDMENTDGLQELLAKKEQEYFSKYLPAFFGFNQTETLIEEIREVENKENRLIQQIEDCDNFIKYFGYGYTKFNYYHCYPKTHIISENAQKLDYELNEKREYLKQLHFDENRFKKEKDAHNDCSRKLDVVRGQLKIYDEQFENNYRLKIEEYCKNNNLGFKQKYQDIKEMLIFQKEYAVKSFKEYLKRKKVNINILDVFKDDSEFNKWREKYLEYDNRKEKLWNDSNKYYYAERNDDLSRILPSEYKTFPLKDRYQEIVFEPIRENELIINFEFSNDGKDEDCLIYRNSIIKMDYKFKCEGIFIEEKNVFLESDETDNNEFKDYFEKDRGDFYTLIKQPFKIRKFGNYISTAMEFYNGINDFTLQDKTKKPLEEVLDRINSVINENTKVTIKTKKGMKKACEEYLEEFYSRDNLLMKKIRRNSKIKYS